MEIFLTKQCEAFTGSLGKGFGYHIQRRKNGFFAKRNSNGKIPADGHLRFIFACAELAQMKTHITDINVSVGELDEALDEATEGKMQTPWSPINAIVNAEQVLTLKEKIGL